jgi:hypothetical protein
VDPREQFRQSVDSQRAQLHADLHRSGGQKEQLTDSANATGFRDNTGKLRDVQYSGGDVNYRMFRYGRNNEPERQGQPDQVTVSSRTQGTHTWNRQGKDRWVNQSGGVFNGEMYVDQKTGQFSTVDARTGEARTYDGRGWQPNPNFQPPNRDGSTVPPSDGSRSVRPPSDGSRGAQPPSDGGIRQAGYEQADGYDKQVEQTFGKERVITDKDKYRDNLFGAAENKKPVVMTFGRGSDPECKAHLEALQKAKEASGGKADFMFVDLDKVDPSSKIGEYAAYIGKDYGTPLTMVFNQKQGERPTPVIPERPIHWQKGPLDTNALSTAVSHAADVQSTREIQTGREKKADNKDGNDPYSDHGAPKGDGKPAGGDNYGDHGAPKGSESPQANIERKQKEAWDQIKAADAAGDKVKSAELRAKLGFACFGWGAAAEKAGKAEEAQAHYMRGAEYIMSAGTFNPNLYKDQGFMDALRNSKLPGDAASYIADRGAENPRWFYPSKEELAKNPNANQDARTAYQKLLLEQMKKPRRKAA